jgi:hypothetical protein
MPHGVRSASAQVGDDEVDPWVQRIEASGCAPQHYALQDCQGAHTHSHLHEDLAKASCCPRLPPPDNLLLIATTAT